MAGMTGADFPWEIITLIALAIGDECQGGPASSKRSFASLSLVCAAWCDTLTPLLFRTLTLRGPPDLVFLRDVVARHQHLPSSPADAIS